MSIIVDDIFINNLPTIDLHGLDSLSACLLVDEFINDHYLLKSNRVVIVHGIGLSILKKEIHKLLAKHQFVASYKLHYINCGCTIVDLISSK